MIPAGPLSIALAADTHGSHRRLSVPPCDIFLFAGDFAAEGVPAEAQAFNDFLGRIPAMHKVVVLGNRDLGCFGSRDEAQGILSNAVVLEGAGVIISGLSVWGTGPVPWYRREDVYARVPDAVDILITHFPPRGAGDLLDSGEHVGEPELLEVVQTRHPRLHVFGDVHEAAGVSQVGATICVNAAVCDSRLVPARGCHELVFTPAGSSWDLAFK